MIVPNGTPLIAGPSSAPFVPSATAAPTGSSSAAPQPEGTQAPPHNSSFLPGASLPTNASLPSNANTATQKSKTAIFDLEDARKSPSFKKLTDLHDKIFASLTPTQKSDLARFLDVYLPLAIPNNEQAAVRKDLLDMSYQRQALERQEAALAAREAATTARETALAAHSAELKDREADLQHRAEATSEMARLEQQLAASELEEATARETNLTTREAALTAREQDVARREAWVATQTDEVLLAEQLGKIWRDGYEAAYRPAFEAGRRAAVPTAYRVHLAALNEVLRRVRGLKGIVEGGAAAGGSGGGDMMMMMRGVVREVVGLERAVEHFMGRTEREAVQTGLDVDQMMGMVVSGEWDEFLRMEGVDPTGGDQVPYEGVGAEVEGGAEIGGGEAA